MIYAFTSHKTQDILIMECEQDISEIVDICKNLMSEEEEKETFDMSEFKQKLTNVIKMTEVSTPRAIRWISKQAMPLIELYKEAVVAFDWDAVYKAYIINVHSKEYAVA